MLVVKRSDLKNSTLSILCVENPLAKELQVLPGLQREPELIYIEDSLKPAKIYGYWRQRPHKNEVIALSTMYALQQ